MNIVIELSSICQVKCDWCWMTWSKKKDLGIMDFNNFKKIVELNEGYFKKNKIKIVPFHRGESLLHPSFFEMMDYLKEKNIPIRDIHTNLSINIDINKLMNTSIPSFIINIGGITKETHERVMKNSRYDLVIKNLKAMLEINKKLKKEIKLKIVPTKKNLHELKNLKYFFEELGGNPDNAIISSTAFTLPSFASKEETNDYFDNVVNNEVKGYLRFTYGKSKKIKVKDKKCNFIMPTIKWDGKVTICCHDQLSLLNLGNAFMRPLVEIFNSAEYQLALKKGIKREFKFCKNCN